MDNKALKINQDPLTAEQIADIVGRKKKQEESDMMKNDRTESDMKEPDRTDSDRTETVSEVPSNEGPKPERKRGRPRKYPESGKKVIRNRDIGDLSVTQEVQNILMEKMQEDPTIDKKTKSHQLRTAVMGSITETSTANDKETADIVSNVLQWQNAKPVESDDECEERLNQFFQHMANTGELPTVEKMCLALGTVRQRVWEWEQGRKGERRADIIKKAKQILAAIDAELVSKNKIPQVTYIFRAKNYFGMSDQQNIVVTPNNPYDGNSPEDVAKRYIEGIKGTDAEGTVE